ncbi:MAG: ribosomal protein S18-alanine N-acetyltransferase [Acidimicrobiia bacterium]|nr:ribosomal protein S18-alanine N-acetyltransferase [Acidimicrobiia bacterium]
MPEAAAEPDVVLSPMRATHLDAVLRIEEAVYPTPWSRSLFESELSKLSTRAYYVAHEGQRLCGYGGLLMAGDEAHVATVAVDPAFQRRGMATRLMLHLSVAALERGASTATLEVRADNTAAQRLYARFGYMPVGVRRGYYVVDGERIDAVIMTAADIRGAAYRERLQALADGLTGTTRVEPDIGPP